MSKKSITPDKKDITRNIVDEFDTLINYDTVNKMIELSGEKDKLGEISKKTLRNISKWALNGDSDKAIAENLELSEKQFQLLCNICPVLVFAMKKSREMADIIISGSLFQTAIGGAKVHKEQLMKLKDYDENGNVIGEHVEKFIVEEELPPNPILLKFMAEHKLSEKFGNKQVDTSEEYKKVLENIDSKQLSSVEKYISSQDKDN